MGKPLSSQFQMRDAFKVGYCSNVYKIKGGNSYDDIYLVRLSFYKGLKNQYGPVIKIKVFGYLLKLIVEVIYDKRIRCVGFSGSAYHLCFFMRQPVPSHKTS